MRDRQASRTAAWVATCRTLGRLLPADARLCDDPHGARLAGGVAGALAEAALRRPTLGAAMAARAGWLTGFVCYMQVRTRALDDVLLAFVRGGGRQLVLLGAGFDARAARFARALGGVRVLEVDHPATQARKRALMAGSPAIYVAWDFERDRMEALGEQLGAHGHDRSARTLTIWEGVTMYLTEPAIEATVAAIGAWSAPGSELALTYFPRARLERPAGRARLMSRLVASVGEPFRFGWDPATLGGWLGGRGFGLDDDRSMREHAAALLPARWASVVSPADSRIALAIRR